MAAGCPQLASLGAGDTLRPQGSGWNCDFSQILGQAPSGAQVNVELAPVRIFTIAGRPLWLNGQPPQPQEVYNAMLNNGQRLLYLEIWENDFSILGLGYDDFYYIGVWY